MNPQLPDYRERQKLIHIEQTPQEVLVAYGDRCRRADRLFDALEFYQKAKHGPGLREIVAAAVSSGDAMLMEQAAKALGAPPSVEDWNRLGRRALALKKYLFARHAFEKGGDGAMLEEIRKIVAGGNGSPDDRNA
jgi:hypothetical protein